MSGLIISAFVLLYMGWARGTEKQAKELLKQFGLTKAADRPFGTYSKDEEEAYNSCWNYT